MKWILKHYSAPGLLRYKKHQQTQTAMRSQNSLQWRQANPNLLRQGKDTNCHHRTGSNKELGHSPSMHLKLPRHHMINQERALRPLDGLRPVRRNQLVRRNKEVCHQDLDLIELPTKKS